MPWPWTKSPPAPTLPSLLDRVALLEATLSALLAVLDAKGLTGDLSGVRLGVIRPLRPTSPPSRVRHATDVQHMTRERRLELQQAARDQRPVPPAAPPASASSNPTPSKSPGASTPEGSPTGPPPIGDLTATPPTATAASPSASPAPTPPDAPQKS